MKKILLTFVCVGASLLAYSQVTHPYRIPDIDGYRTLQCDFHTHTFFSDGQVSPSFRVDEAFADGLDAIAITEHIEHRPNVKSGLLNADHNRSYEMAANNGKAKSNEVTVIHGCEITRGMPPGHINAIFLNDCNPIDTENWRDAIAEAGRQGAFIFWNHPGWERQAPDTTIWYPEHSELFDKGYIKGIEVANSRHYFPEAQQWALEKGLTMLGDGDLHSSSRMQFDYTRGEHRTVTFVFATDNSPKAIREALDKGRTAVWYGDNVIGREEYLKALLKASVEVVNMKRTKNNISITVRNNSDFIFFLSKHGHDMNLNYVRDVILRPNETYSFNVTFKKVTSKKVILDFRVDNFLSAPSQGMDCKLTVPAFK